MYIVDVKVQVEPGQKYFYPDVLVTCDERDTDPQLVQFPCLIIEVLSPSTEAADGLTQARRPIHIQCSYPSRPLVRIITLYQPDPQKWDQDFTQRRNRGDDL